MDPVLVGNVMAVCLVGMIIGVALLITLLIFILTNQ